MSQKYQIVIKVSTHSQSLYLPAVNQNTLPTVTGEQMTECSLNEVPKKDQLSQEKTTVFSRT